MIKYNDRKNIQIQIGVAFFMKGLIIKEPWIDLILSNKKKWEIRGNATTIRGKIFLIKSGTGCILGHANLVDCFSISTEQLQASFSMHRIPTEDVLNIKYSKPHVWVLENPIQYKTPIPYKHPKGAVIWVNLDNLESE